MKSLFNKEKAREFLPEHMQDGMELWIDEGIEPGNFLQSVLTNNLKEAVLRADHTPIFTASPTYIRFLWDYAPAGCWGSVEKYSAWKKWFEDERNKRAEQQL